MGISSRTEKHDLSSCIERDVRTTKTRSTTYLTESEWEAKYKEERNKAKIAIKRGLLGR